MIILLSHWLLFTKVYFVNPWFISVVKLWVAKRDKFVYTVMFLMFGLMGSGFDSSENYCTYHSQTVLHGFSIQNADKSNIYCWRFVSHLLEGVSPTFLSISVSLH